MTHPATHLHVAALTPETAHWWVEAGPAVPDPAAAAAQIRAFVTDTPNGALLAAMDGDRALARLQVCPVGACGLGLFAIGGREGEDDQALARAADALLSRAIAIGRDTPGVRYLETDLPSAMPHAALWRDAMARAGVSEVAVSHTYALDLGDGDRPAGPARTLVCRPAGPLAPEALVAIYAATYEGTADESHRLSPESFAVRLERLRAIPVLAPDGSGWRVAFEGDRPLGLVFASPEAPPHGDPANGWIVEIGIAPAARGRGLGRALLETGLAALAERGVRRVLARIDDRNLPSVRLHTGAGFARQPGASRLYRLVWPQ
ncbi:MAG: GNAT family N-acetyltransferase [Candidatus Sericytochromatia bacterium]